MAEATSQPQPDKIVPTEKRSHHARTGATRGRPRTRNTTPKEPPAGIVQAPPIVKSELDTITEGLATLYGTIGTLVMFGNEYDGLVILQNAQNMANSVVAACRPYPTAWKILGLVVQGNVWSVLVLAHLGPAVAIMANHGALPHKAAAAFRQAPIPTAQPQGGQEGAPGPYTYPGDIPPGMNEQEMSAQQQQELAQYLAAMAIQQGQMTAQQEQAMYAPPPIANGAVGMDSISGLGDAETAQARAMFTAHQMNMIREESLRKTQEQNGQ